MVTGRRPTEETKDSDRKTGAARAESWEHGTQTGWVVDGGGPGRASHTTATIVRHQHIISLLTAQWPANYTFLFSHKLNNQIQTQSYIKELLGMRWSKSKYISSYKTPHCTALHCTVNLVFRRESPDFQQRLQTTRLFYWDRYLLATYLLLALCIYSWLADRKSLGRTIPIWLGLIPYETSWSYNQSSCLLKVWVVPSYPVFNTAYRHSGNKWTNSPRVKSTIKL